MKGLWGFLSIIVFAFVVTACGGGGGGGTPAGNANSISGTTIAGATLNLSGQVTASTTANTSGSYSFSGLASGAYVITPSFTGYTFSPTNTTVNFTSGNYTGVNFAATPNSGVVFAGVPSGGATSMTDTHYVNAVVISGGILDNPVYANGTTYGWVSSTNSADALMSFYSPLGQDNLPHDALDISFFLGTLGDLTMTFEKQCGVSVDFWSKAIVHFPLCSSLGITFDRSAGTIAFAASTMPSQDLNHTNTITVWGTLTFAPF